MKGDEKIRDGQSGDSGRESAEARNPETLRVPLTLSAWKNLDNPDSQIHIYRGYIYGLPEWSLDSTSSIR